MNNIQLYKKYSPILKQQLTNAVPVTRTEVLVLKHFKPNSRETSRILAGLLCHYTFLLLAEDKYV